MPITYNAQDAATCWPTGEYDATLSNVEDTTSKRKPDGSGGNPMQVWTFDVYHPDGRKQTIKDYVVVPAATFKIKQLADALGQTDQFRAGTFQADDHRGEMVRLDLKVEERVGYPDQNKVNNVRPPRRADAAPPADKDIPF